MTVIHITSRAAYLKVLADMWKHVPADKVGVVIFKAPKYRK